MLKANYVEDRRQPKKANGIKKKHNTKHVNLPIQTKAIKYLTRIKKQKKNIQDPYGYSRFSLFPHITDEKYLCM